MKKMEKYIVRNWIWLVTGLILTRKAIEFAYAERGYVAFGGEWLVLPEEGDAGDRRTSRHHRRMAK